MTKITRNLKFQEFSKKNENQIVTEYCYCPLLTMFPAIDLHM